jgi:hypothetical protein
MLDENFKKQRATAVRSLAEKAIDPFIEARLTSLVERCEPSRQQARTTTPVDLQFATRGNGPER